MTKKNMTKWMLVLIEEVGNRVVERVWFSTNPTARTIIVIEWLKTCEDGFMLECKIMVVELHRRDQVRSVIRKKDMKVD